MGDQDNNFNLMSLSVLIVCFLYEVLQVEHSCELRGKLRTVPRSLLRIFVELILKNSARVACLNRVIHDHVKR